MLNDILSTALLAVLTAAGGSLATFLSNRFRKVEEKQKEEGESLADALIAEAQIARIKVIETLLEKAPPGADLEAFFSRLEAAVTATRTFAHGPNESGKAANDESWTVIERLVNSYHQQALSQARAQFWFSVTAATVGFALIIYAFISTLGAVGDKFSGLTEILPGTVMDAVAFLFFRQAEATRQRATALYDRLRVDRQQIQAIGLVNTIEDKAVSSAVRAQLALHMAGLSPAAIDLTAFITKSAPVAG